MINWLTQHPDQANALAAVANAFLAALALVVATTSIVFAAKGLRTQRQHNRLSVRPIPFIACADYEDLLRVKVRNDGVGPLLITSVRILKNGKALHEELVSYMPSLPAGLHWTNFSSGYVRSIQAGNELILLELDLDPDKALQRSFRDNCRNALKSLEIIVSYTDIYGDMFPAESRKLDWFGRRLASSRAPR